MMRTFFNNLRCSMLHLERTAAYSRYSDATSDLSYLRRGSFSECHGHGCLESRMAASLRAFIDLAQQIVSRNRVKAS
jgi:hypothetical protein